MTQRTIVHGSFTAERTYPVPAERAFAAWADPEIKARWFGGPDEINADDRVFEFRVGGREYNSGNAPNGASYTFDLRYQDIVLNQRIVYTYEMHLEGKRISVSVAAIEFVPEGAGTRLIVTEHGVFLDGLDTPDQRQSGTEWLMDQLGEELGRKAA